MRTKNLLGLVLCVFAALTSCSTEPEPSELANAATFQPTPKDPNTVKSRLSRFEGQTSFLNPMSDFFGGARGGLEGAANQESAGFEQSGSDQRALQDSDIYKLGKPGSKILYLLNSARGLQVVSFANGPESPILKGRVPATGNDTEKMYYLQKQDAILIIEREKTSSYRNYSSRILLYTVADPAKPTLVEEVRFKGEASDTRLVGDVLYIAGSREAGKNNNLRSVDSWSFNPSNDPKPEGFVSSYKLTNNSIDQVADRKLVLPVQKEDMNIVEVPLENGRYNYYLVAAASKSRWSWWRGEKSMIEVVDVTKPTGEIEPVMVVPAKGRIVGRSSTHIQDDAIVVVSNYRANVEERIDRVAVETFTFPSKDSEILSPEELTFRELRIKREINKALESGAASEQIAKMQSDLEKDEDLGLHGRFVQTEQGFLQKIQADTLTTVGDTRGMSARLQDVRIHGEHLYVFWVPTNNIDPLEVFHIADLQAGAPHLGRLEFEGWIERSFPMSYKGKNYILGLGQIVPPINNERGRRKPQARLFEVRQLANGKVKAVDIADLEFASSNLWTNFNRHDRFVELRMTGEGKGVLLFQASQYENNASIAGGKLISFDLNKVDSSDVFEEGGLLKANWGWLRRVFSNPELDMVNTFTNEELGVFGVQEIGNADDVFDAIGVLELARNIKEYLTLADGEGLQVVQKGYSYYWGGDADRTETQLRLVDSKKADAEIADTLSQLSLKGSFVDIEQMDGSFLVMTRVRKKVTHKEPTVDTFYFNTYETTLILTKVKKTADGLVAEVSKEFDPTTAKGQEDTDDVDAGSFRRPGPFVSQFDGNLVRLESGLMVMFSGKDLFIVDPKDLTTKTAELKECNLKDAGGVEIKKFDNGLFLKSSFTVGEDGKRIAPDKIDYNAKQPLYQENFVTPLFLLLELDPNVEGGVYTGNCNPPINVPGDVVNVRGDHILTVDQWLVDRVEHRYKDSHDETKERVWFENIIKNPLTSLKIQGEAGRSKVQAQLVDLYDLGSVPEWRVSNLIQSSKNDGSLLFVGQKDEQRNYWREISTLVFDKITFDPVSLRFRKQSSYLDSELAGSQTNIVDTVQLGDRELVVISSGSNIQLVDLESGDKPQIVPLQVKDQYFEWGEPQDYLSLSTWYYGHSTNESGLDVDLEQQAINFPLGLSGVTQIRVAE